MTIIFVILIFASAVVAVYVANRHAAKVCKAEKEQVSLFINSKKHQSWNLVLEDYSLQSNDCL